MRAPWKTVWRSLKELKIELPYDPAIPLLGIYPGKIEALILKDTCTPVFTVALFIIAKTWSRSFNVSRRWNALVNVDFW